MAIPNYSIQYTFFLPERPKISISAESHDYSGPYGVCPGYLGALIPQKAPPGPEDHAQQFREKTSRHILQKLGESTLPGKDRAINYLKDPHDGGEQAEHQEKSLHHSVRLF